MSGWKSRAAFASPEAWMSQAFFCNSVSPCPSKYSRARQRWTVTVARSSMSRVYSTRLVANNGSICRNFRKEATSLPWILNNFLSRATICDSAISSQTFLSISVAICSPNILLLRVFQQPPKHKRSLSVSRASLMTASLEKAPSDTLGCRSRLSRPL